MKYLFTETEIKGVFPIKNIQICWYDMLSDGHCFDEEFIQIENFNVKDLMHIETEDENNIFKSRVFINTINNESYELVLKKVNNKGE